MTGGRIAKAKQYLKDKRFLLTYGDGVADVNISNLINRHIQSGKTVTMTAVQPKGKFGALNIDTSGNILSFKEKTSG